MAYSGAFGHRTPPSAPGGTEPKRTPPEGGIPGLSSLLKKIEVAGMETDDLLMALVLFLMYRESGDKDLLIMLGAMLLT